MKYEFPHVSNISQVLPLIKDRPEFIVAEKEGGYTVVNYVVQTGDTFPPVSNEGDAILRELRGMIFDTKTGKVLHRRLHKFFNANEREETQVKDLNLDEPHVILEKLDGSMITPVITDTGMRWGTKMGVTQVALPVEGFISTHPEYETFIGRMLPDYTPIFEWCSRQQTIVIDYPEDMLVLTAIRNNITGEYVSYNSMLALGREFMVPVVKAYNGTASNMSALVEETKGLIGAEGFVVRFDDGHMVKVKAEDYLRKHKTKEAISREKNVVELLVTEKADDVKAFMDEKDLTRFNDFESKFWKGLSETASNLVLVRHQAEKMGFDVNKKSYAVNFVQLQPPTLHRFLYSMFDVKVNALNLLKESIASSCGTQTKIDECRWMFKCNWSSTSLDE